MVMGHVRILRHYIHTNLLLNALAEMLLVGIAAYLGYATRYGEFPPFFDLLSFACLLAFTLVLFTLIMGVQEAGLREGPMGVLTRTGVAYFLLGTLTMLAFKEMLPGLFYGNWILVFSEIIAFVLVSLYRWNSSHFLNEDFLKRRVVVLGTGQRALRIANRMRRRSDRRAFVLLGFLQLGEEEDLVGEYNDKVLSYPADGLEKFCQDNKVDEIVVAVSDRRAGAGTPIPYNELMEIRLSGVNVCEVQDFIEREACKIDVDLLQRNWLVFSDGFISNRFRRFNKRAFDIFVASTLFVAFLPVMLLTVLAVWLADRGAGPIFYRQRRVGEAGKVFEVIKFRTMQPDAEESGEVWADHNDPRTTSIGGFLRKSRLDELPQLVNVLRGEMSMVGPRPERPRLVEMLSNEIDYYDQRHRITPGLTGWAQLCYPYGASVEDSKQKLQYDLYYLKNHSLLLDIIIMFQTVEVVLVGEGAR